MQTTRNLNIFAHFRVRETNKTGVGTNKYKPQLVVNMKSTPDAGATKSRRLFMYYRPRTQYLNPLLVLGNGSNSRKDLSVSKAVSNERAACPGKENESESQGTQQVLGEGGSHVG